MNRKTKKLLVSLLSVLMVLSFMPTMAFAYTAPTIDGHPKPLVNNTKASVAPTEETFGVDVFTCAGETIEDSEGTNVTLACNAKASVLTPKAGHTWSKNTIKLTKAEYMVAMAEQGQFATLNDLAKFVKDTKDACYLFVRQCDECKEYEVVKDGNSWAPSGVWEDHVVPQGTDDCKETYICEVCGEEITRTVSTAASATTCKAHTWKYQGTDPTSWKYVGFSCGTNTTTRYNHYQNECTVCGETVEEAVYYRPQGGADSATHTFPKAEYNTTAAFQAAVPEAERQYYLVYDGKVYKPNGFNKNGTPPTCQAPSSDDYGQLVCEECGNAVWFGVTRGDGQSYSTCPVPQLEHVKLPVVTPATCEADGMEATVCAVCGTCFKERVGEKATGHTYKTTVISAPTVYEDGITLVECEKCGKFTTNRYADLGYTADANNTKYVAWNTAVENSKDQNKGDWYFVGFSKELKDASDKTIAAFAKAIKLDPWQKLTAHFGAYEKMSDPTCTLPELQACKDSVSGDFDVHHIKKVGSALGHKKTTITVEPTCGTWGYTYTACETCKRYLTKAGKTIYYEGNFDPEYVGYDFVKPLVAEGTPCQYEWKVTKVPTATEDGEKALVCTKCNSVKEGSQTVVPKDSDEAKNAVIAAEADPAIEAASTVIADKANYKADSVKAIEEARAMLNQAIAAGSAADVSRAAAKLQAAVSAAAKKDANPMTAKGKTVKANAKKKTTFSAKKAFTVKKAQGKVTYKKKSGNGKVKIASNGKVTVKKGLKAGKTYKIKVTVKAAGNDNYLAKSKVVTLKVKVK